MSENFSVIPSNLAIDAMRYSGYKNTAYALAELIDNAIEADAKNVEVFIFETNEDKRLAKIAVLDDGNGMDPITLRRALQFGNGTKLKSRKGIGRFGMGLPNSSISQSLRTEIYTWKNGSTNASFSFLDIQRIKKGEADVPEPEAKSVPDEYRDLAAPSHERHGTLVIWSELDYKNVTWKKASTLVKHAEQIVGRVYRKFISENKIRIIFYTIYNDSKGNNPVEVQPIDPLYLMEGTKMPGPFDKKPMFQLLEGSPIKFEIDLWDNVSHKVFLKFSYAKEETIDHKKVVETIDLAREMGTHNRGNTPYGKHAKQNCGLSIIRAGRELMLDHRWCTEVSPLNRWWGASIEFEPDLDEFFGVSNNKQYANTLDSLINFKLDDEIPEGMNEREYLRQLEEERNPRWWLIQLHEKIHNGIGEVFKKIKKQGEGTRREEGVVDIDKEATKAIQERAKDYPTTTDCVDPRENREKIVKTSREIEITDPEKETDLIIRENLKVRFVEKKLDTPAFFQVRDTEGGVFFLQINENHPFHKSLSDIISPIESTDEKELRARLKRCEDAIKLLLAAYARMELEYEGHLQEQAKDIRYDWGRVSKYFFQEEK